MNDIIDLHLSQDFICPSTSTFASALFLIPKSDPKVQSHWVCDYRRLNNITVPDHYPMPKISEILSNCVKGKFFYKIDLKNSYFQTCMHPNDIHKTAVLTPRSLYEWMVMPMGLCNAPAIQQHQIESVLCPLLRNTCHGYIENKAGFSPSLEMHITNVHKILHCVLQVCTSILTKLNFSPLKLNSWATLFQIMALRPQEKGRSHPRLADSYLHHTSSSISWYCMLPSSLPFQTLFPLLCPQGINPKTLQLKIPPLDSFPSKLLVTSQKCLTVIDPNLMPDHKIFIMMDASDLASGAVLCFGTSWKSARPVAYDSCSFKHAELNYPVYEKKLLAVVRALKK